MSDITKKILSLEPDSESEITPVKGGLIRSIEPMDAPASVSDKISEKSSSPQHASDIPSLRRNVANPESFPGFISRDDTLTPQTVDTIDYTATPPKTAWIVWTGIILTLIWVAASIAIYFGLFAVTPLTPMAISGFVMAVLLPVILITLLSLTWRRLVHISHEAGRLAHAAHILTRADESALTHTRNLAVGIQSELSLVDEHLNKMLKRFETLKSDITTHSQDINNVGLALSERSDDVGRNLTLQRQALESITSTFDTRMETLGNTIETQSQKLSEVTQIAAKNIEAAEHSLTQAAHSLDQSEQGLITTSQTTSETLATNMESLNKTHTQLSDLHTKLSEFMDSLTAQHNKIKSELLTQSENLQDMSNMAKDSTDTLQHNLSLGSDLLTALTTANQGTQDAVQQRFSDMENMIAQTQDSADALADAANKRVRDSLAQTRKDLSKLEADMQVLSTQLSNAREQSTQLDLMALNTQKAEEQAGFGRLKLKPLETDFPPVEPPRFPSRAIRDETQAQLNLDDEDAFALDSPIHLGADMEIADPDAELTNFDPETLLDPETLRPDIVRPAAPIGKSFGKTRNTKDKEKSGWHWRDMLGGLEKPDTNQDTSQAAPLSAPALSSNPLTMPADQDVLNRLYTAQLSPPAIVDEGTIIEAAKARITHGPAAMHKSVESRLASPINHLRTQLSQDAAFQTIAKDFVTQYDQIIAQSSPNDNSIRETLGTTEGRAYLLCAAALSHIF